MLTLTRSSVWLACVAVIGTAACTGEGGNAATAATNEPAAAPSAPRRDSERGLPRLSIHLVNEDPVYVQDAVNGAIPPGYGLLRDEEFFQPMLVSRDVIVDGRDLQNASIGIDDDGRRMIMLLFNQDGARRFGRATAAHQGRRLAVVFDGQVLSAPIVEAEISNGQVGITGNYSEEEATRLLRMIRTDMD